MIKEMPVFKFTYRAVPLLLILLLGSVGHASAQSVSAFFGVGTATDSANGQSYDFFQTGTPLAAPKLTGTFATFGAEFMFRKHLGFGGEYAARFSQENYAGLGLRPTFYDFNAVYQPISRPRIVPEFQAGIGGATMHFYTNQSFCLATCKNVSTPLQNSSHFQFHASAGVKLYVKGNIFIRPQFDLHLVPNLGEFGSNFVPQYTVALGYTFGER